MRWRRDDRRQREAQADPRRGEERDLELGGALDALDVPDYPAEFLTSVWARVDAGEDASSETPIEQARTAETARASGAVGAGRLRRSPSLWRRHPVVATAAACAIALAVAAAVLVGVPGLSPLSGPPPVSAAEVIQKALRAVSSGHTLVVDITARDTPEVLRGEIPISPIRLWMRSDGSYRLLQTDIAPTSLGGPDRRGIEGSVYDARTGVLRHYVRGWEADADAYFNVLEVTTRWPPGPPDSWVGIEQGLGSVALALQTGSDATVTTATYEGRPVWVVTVKGMLPMREKSERSSVAIDQKTCLPLHLQTWRDEGLQIDITWRYVSRNKPLPERTFTSAPSEGAKVTRKDAGFHRVPMDRIAARRGYLTLVPAWLPPGYRQQGSAFAARSTTANGATEGRHVVALQYVRGFDALTITTRTVKDPLEAARYDPVEAETAYAEVVRRDVRLKSGALAGATAKLVVAPGIMIPHLYVVKDNVLLTVTGSATADELLAIAESLRPYRAAASTP